MTKPPLPHPRCVLYVRTIDVTNASGIIARLTGESPYKNLNCDHNVGCFDPEDDKNIQYTCELIGQSSEKDWTDVFLFFRLAGEIIQRCVDVEIGLSISGSSGTANIWASDLYKKRTSSFKVSKDTIEASVLDKFKRIQDILGEQS